MTSFGDTLSLGSSTHRLPYSFPHDAASCHGDDFNVLDHSLAKGHFSACSITSVREAAVTPRATWVGHQPCSLSPVAQISTHRHQQALALQMENSTIVNDVGTTEYLPRHFSQCLDNGWGHPQYSGSGEEGVVPIKSVHLGTPNYKVRRPLDMTVQEIAEETTDLSNMEVYGWPLEVVDHSYGQDTGASEYITRSHPIHLGDTPNVGGVMAPHKNLHSRSSWSSLTQERFSPRAMSYQNPGGGGFPPYRPVHSWIGPTGGMKEGPYPGQQDLGHTVDHIQKGGSGIEGRAHREGGLLGTHIHNDIGRDDTILNIRRTLLDISRDLRNLNYEIAGRGEDAYESPLEHDSTTLVHTQTTGRDRQ